MEKTEHIYTHIVFVTLLF